MGGHQYRGNRRGPREELEAVIWANSGALVHGTDPMRREAMSNILDAIADIGKRGPLQPCGTRAAYTRHKRHGEVPCEPCNEANRADAQRRRKDGAT